MDVKQYLDQHGGIGRARDMAAAGVSEAERARAVRTGVVTRPARGIYALPGHDGLALRALSLGADLACISAAQARGLWVMRQPRKLHLAVDHGRAIPGDDLRIHRAVRPVSDLGVCLQAARCLPELDALCILESAVVAQRITIAGLRERATFKSSGALRRLLALIDPHSESILETIARYHLLRAGHHVASQVHLPGVGRLDLVVDGVLGIEADGRQHHTDRREFEEDRRRWNLLTTRGYPVLRVTYALLVNEPDRFLLLVESALAMHSRSR